MWSLIFKDAKIIRGIFSNNTPQRLSVGLDTPEFYSFLVSMKDVDKFVFGKLSVNEFWKKITFFKKKEIDVTNQEIKELNIPYVI